MSAIYLLASLPMLAPGTPPPLTGAAFLEACREQLAASDADACAALLEGGDAPHPAVRRWRAKEAVLRNAVARIRARARGQDAGRWLRPTPDCDVSLERIAEAAMQEPDPLQRERALERARWNAAEELAGCDPLAKARVFAYAVQLGIALRGQGRDAAAGRNVFENLTEVPIVLG